MKKSILSEVLSWAMMVSALCASGCFGGKHHQVSANLIDDKVTVARVQSALDASAGHEFKGVKISCTNGVVTLQGTVASEAQKEKADELTRSVDRVQDLHDEIVLNQH